MARVADSVLDLIGETPMVQIKRLNPNQNVQILAKLEGWNPTGSIKDRIALNMIKQALGSGELCPGKIILEPTSGNTGIGLCIVGIVLGYRVMIVMSEAVSIERRKLMQAYGAEVLLTPGKEGTDGAIRKVRQMVKDDPDKYFFPNQFSSEFNLLAHYQNTAQEIWAQTKGKITHLVSALGTSGTIMGISKYLKEKNPDLQVIAAQAERGHYIQGLKHMGEAIVPAIYNRKYIDKTVLIDSESAIHMTREIIQHEAIPAGMSSGAALMAAWSVVREVDQGCVVVIFPDRCEKYLSTSLFDPRKDLPCLLDSPEYLKSYSYMTQSRL